MGIYLGQLPPAEIARLKAELAETLIANFCYPRFFDYRTDSLRMRPVDRAKRQEVWLYLSSFDFTAWGRLELASPDFQLQVERLFIQFVQRNRSFFGEQGRKRMTDIRMLIGTSAVSVVQGLRNHLSGQKQGNVAFGSPRPVVSWSAPTNGRTELTWEQIAASTMALQQQLQEARGEIKPAPVADGRATTGAPRRMARPPVGGTSAEYDRPSAPRAPVVQPPQVNTRPAASVATGTRGGPSLNPAATANPATMAPPRQSGPLHAPVEMPMPRRGSEPLVTPVELPPISGPLSAKPAASGSYAPPLPEIVHTPAPVAPPSRGLTQPTPRITQPTGGNQRDASVMPLGEDDAAIFEQMRHQLLVWLRVEAVKANLDISGQGPAQLLEALRQQGRMDETHLQVVSTLLNLSNQVVKTGMVSILDYKQALMFHLMHTKR